jgi:hypothetical protein
MSVKSFKFISPGIFINEIDNSQLPAIADEIGPVIVGRTEKGPGMRPVKVNSFSEYVSIFGNPIPGGQGGDVWRDGNHTSATYAAYAAQAYLRNSNAVTVVRLLGAQEKNLSSTAPGRAGWETAATTNTALAATNGGAFGLFVFTSGSAAAGQVTGTLAAVWYLNEGAIELSGTIRGSTTISSSAGTLYDSLSTTPEYKVIIRDDGGENVKETAFNFNRASAKYARKVFNTNPTLVNTNITRTAQQKTYWLGPTFERELASVITGSSHAMILGLDSGSLGASADFRFEFQAAQSPWIFSQDLSTDGTNFDILDNDRVTKLFKFHSLDSGEDVQKEVKVSITGIKASSNRENPYGSFNVEVRDLRDSDNSPVILESYTSVNLNPASSNFIGRVIGTQRLVWDNDERRYRIYGDYPNASSIIRVELNEDVLAGVTDARFLPFGSYGPPRYKRFTLTSGSALPASTWADLVVPHTSSRAVGKPDNILHPDTGPGDQAFVGEIIYPGVALRVSASSGEIPDPTDAYFGFDSTQADNNRFEDSNIDLARVLPSALDSFVTQSSTEYSYLFTLDDVKPFPAGSKSAVYLSGSRKAGTSFTAVSGTYEQVLDNGYDRFTVPMHGGFNGLDITEKDPFNNTRALEGTDNTKYAFFSVRRAIDTVANPEEVEYNLMAVPGIYKESLTAHAIEVCERRGDALAVIDLDSGYRTSAENVSSDEANRGSVTTAVNNLRNRGLNSSYGVAYYPWVQIRDNVNDSLLFAPPSVVALGTYSSAQRDSELWFAPAGFTRGGLTEGSAGLPVVQTRERLTSKERDTLYEANINPIATFPAEGIVIFGQKTLQVTPSALDRVNVRRLMIFLKREISRIAATTLFDQNVQATWNRFKGRADALLTSVQARLGLTDYKIVLDSSTTTPELVDRNIMYAKIFLKPARAIEFIALDFVITNSGAGFED